VSDRRLGTYGRGVTPAPVVTAAARDHVQTDLAASAASTIESDSLMSDTPKRVLATIFACGVAALATAPAASAAHYTYKGQWGGYMTVVDTDSCGANGHSCTRAYQIRSCGKNRVSGRIGVADLFYSRFSARGGWSGCAASYTPHF
jgi:hypothetical protein